MTARSADSSRLRDIGGLDEQIQHVVAAFGIGNNCSVVKNDEVFNTGLAEAPYYTDVAKEEYGRYIALYHLASDTDGDENYIANEVFGSPKLLAILDTKGDWYDEEFAEYTGQKQ